MKLDDLMRIAAHIREPMADDGNEKLQSIMQELGLDPANLYQELEMSSRYAQVHQDTSDSRSIQQLHSHNFYEILCCRSNCGAEYLVGAERYRLQRGDIVVVPPGVSHRPLLPEDMKEPYVRDVLWVGQDLIEMLHQMFPQLQIERYNQGNLLRTTGTRWEHLPELLRASVREAEVRLPGWEMIVLGNSITFMSQLKRAYQDKNTVPAAAEKPQLLEQAMAYIEANLSEKISLEEIARSLFVSESTIRQVFRKKMGVSFYRCVTQRRLIAAKTLIAEGVLLEEISRKVGFSDYSSFFKAFKQEYGISPRQYRNL